MGPGNSREQAGDEARYRMMLIIWAALLASVGLYAAVGFAARPAAQADAGGPVALFALGGLGLAMAVLSFVLKGALLRRAVARRDPGGVQAAYVVAQAVSESVALFGLVALFVTGDARSSVLFAAGALCLLLHRPRREHLSAASGGGGAAGAPGSFGNL